MLSENEIREAYQTEKETLAELITKVVLCLSEDGTLQDKVPEMFRQQLAAIRRYEVILQIEGDDSIFGRDVLNFRNL